MSEKKWIMRTSDVDAVKQLTDDGIPRLSAKVLSARKFRTCEAVRAAFGQSYEQLGDPLSIAGMPEAVERLRNALKTHTKVAIYGDYDVDGIMAVTLLVEWLRGKNADCVYYIPGRLDEGYGLTEAAIKCLADNGVKLIITVDTGITAVDETAFASSLGVDIIITDHHECHETLPHAAAVVNPMRRDSKHPFKYFAGVGVAFMLALAFDGAGAADALVAAHGDLAAVGTIADVVPMIGPNRVITARGLEIITRTTRVGLKALIRESVQEGKRIHEAVVGFSLAPRINAAGRMGKAEEAVELFLAQTYEQADAGAKRLCELNRLRQKVENDMLDEISEQAESMIAQAACGSDCAPRALVLSSDRWHQGVVGIVASRLSERYACPVFLICIENGMGKGSARSFFGVNIMFMMRRASHLLESWGGHEFAAGFTIKENNIPIFRELLMELSQTLSPAHIEIDAELNADDLEPELVSGLKMLEPHGPVNDAPTFLLRDVVLADVVPLGTGKSARLSIVKDGRSFSALYFGRDPVWLDICDGDRGDVLVHATTEARGGKNEVVLLLTDMRMPRETERLYAREMELVDRFCCGGAINPSEARNLLPRKRDFVALIRHLKRNCDDESGYVARIGTLCRRVSREEKIDESYARMMVCLAALDEKERLRYTLKGDVLSIKMLGDKPIDLNDSHVLKRINDIIHGEEVCGDERQRSCGI